MQFSAKNVAKFPIGQLAHPLGKMDAATVDRDRRGGA